MPQDIFNGVCTAEQSEPNNEQSAPINDEDGMSKKSDATASNGV
jgi:hypothetical protein